MGKPLLVTKYLIPGRRVDLVRRPRLPESVHEHAARRRVPVCALAGSGKTSLLVQRAHDADLLVCRFTIGRGDRDLHVLAEDCVVALAHRLPPFGRQAQRFLAQSESLADSEGLAGILTSKWPSSRPVQPETGWRSLRQPARRMSGVLWGRAAEDGGRILRLLVSRSCDGAEGGSESNHGSGPLDSAPMREQSVARPLDRFAKIDETARVY